MTRKTIISAITAVAVITIASYSMFGGIMNNHSTTYVCIDADDDRDSVIEKIHESAHPTTMLGFRILATVTNLKVRTGRYQITPDMSMLKLFKNIRGHIREPLRVVVPVTRTMNQLAKRLSQELMPDSAAFAQAFNDSLTCAQFGFTPSTMAAFIIPDTYEFYWEADVMHVLNKLNRNYRSFWNENRLDLARKANLTPLQVSILASIVDAESDYAPEKPRIAGLYLNRLRDGQPLQSDPTVIFAIGNFNIHRVSNAQTRFSSPYNTYMNCGLPPGPIRIPSKEGIDAVLHAEKHNYKYMCAKEDFSGSHNFASSYAEHLDNAARYTRALNEHGIMK